MKIKLTRVLDFILLQVVSNQPTPKWNGPSSRAFRGENVNIKGWNSSTINIDETSYAKLQTYFVYLSQRNCHAGIIFFKDKWN